MNYKVLVAGGQCGTTMLIASDKIEEYCAKFGVNANVTIQNLWETTYVAPYYDLIIEMFPYFKEEKCQVISGKAFINHLGEKELLQKIFEILKEKKL